MNTYTSSSQQYTASSNCLRPQPATHLSRRWLWILLLTVFIPAFVRGGTIDFEAALGQLPWEGLSISNQYQAQFGVRFSRVGGGYPKMVRKGAPVAAFKGPGDFLPDMLSPLDPKANDFGDFFLAEDVEFGAANFGLVLDYDAPVSMASGYIFDVDGTDQITIVAYRDSAGKNELSRTVITPSTKGSGDGRAVQWSFISARREIGRIVLFNTGDLRANVAFDHFSSDYAPTDTNLMQTGIELYPGLELKGQVGRTYRIDYTEDIGEGQNGAILWTTLTTLVLPSPTYYFMDTEAARAPRRFYRVVGQP